MKNEKKIEITCLEDIKNSQNVTVEKNPVRKSAKDIATFHWKE